MVCWNGEPGTAGEDTGVLLGPRGIAVSQVGHIYFTDTGNKRVLVYNQGGRFLFQFGLSGDGKLDEPVV